MKANLRIFGVKANELSFVLSKKDCPTGEHFSKISSRLCKTRWTKSEEKGNLRILEVKANELSFVLSKEDYRLGRVI